VEFGATGSTECRWRGPRAGGGRCLARPEAGLRTVVAHLGSGCSATAIDGGRSVATSMGLTPLEGLMMGTRPARSTGHHVYLLPKPGASTRRAGRSRWSKVGLMAVSGRTSDVRELMRLGGRQRWARDAGSPDLRETGGPSARRRGHVLPAVDRSCSRRDREKPGAAARIVAGFGSIGVRRNPGRAVAEDARSVAHGVAPRCSGIEPRGSHRCPRSGSCVGVSRLSWRASPAAREEGVIPA